MKSDINYDEGSIMDVINLPFEVKITPRNVRIIPIASLLWGFWF